MLPQREKGLANRLYLRRIVPIDGNSRFDRDLHPRPEIALNVGDNRHRPKLKSHGMSCSTLSCGLFLASPCQKRRIRNEQPAGRCSMLEKFEILPALGNQGQSCWKNLTEIALQQRPGLPSVHPCPYSSVVTSSLQRPGDPRNNKPRLLHFRLPQMLDYQLPATPYSRCGSIPAPKCAAGMRDGRTVRTLMLGPEASGHVGGVRSTPV